MYPGGSVTLKVNAGALAGAGLGYQWQNGIPALHLGKHRGRHSRHLHHPGHHPGRRRCYRVQVLNQVALRL